MPGEGRGCANFGMRPADTVAGRYQPSIPRAYRILAVTVLMELCGSYIANFRVFRTAITAHYLTHALCSMKLLIVIKI